MKFYMTLLSERLINFVILNQENENKEELKTKLKEVIREKSDAFNSDNHEEDKVRSSDLD